MIKWALAGLFILSLYGNIKLYQLAMEFQGDVHDSIHSSTPYTQGFKNGENFGVKVCLCGITKATQGEDAMTKCYNDLKDLKLSDLDKIKGN